MEEREEIHAWAQEIGYEPAEYGRIPKKFFAAYNEAYSGGWRGLTGYSVPARYAGRRLQVRLGATTVTVVADGTVVATHARSLHKHTEDLVLDHYLEVLARKPGALAGATALAAARASGAFTGAHQRFWDAARRQLGDTAGTRALIGVLLLHRSLPSGEVASAMGAAAAMGRFDADLVAVEARRAGQAAAPPPQVVVPAHAAAVARRPAPALGAYDELTGAVGA